MIRPSEETYEEHLDIVNAIINKNHEEAEKAIKLDLMKSKEVVEQKVLANKNAEAYNL